MRARIILVALAAVLIAGPGAEGQGAPPAVGLIFGAPDIHSPRLSPDGERLVFVEHSGVGRSATSTVLTYDISADRPILLSAVPVDSGVRWANWANNQRILISVTDPVGIRGGGYAYMIDQDGKLYVTDSLNLNYIISMRPDGSDQVMLFAENRRRIGINQRQLDYVIDYLPQDPEHILMGVRSHRNARLDVYRVNVETGRARRVDSGLTESLAWYTNSNGVTVMRMDYVPRRSEVSVLVREADGALWTRVAQNPINNFSELHDGVTWVARTDAVNEALVLANNEESGRTSLYRYDFFSNELIEEVWSHPVYDVAQVLVDPVSARALALTWADERTHVVTFDPFVAEHLPAIQSALGDEVVVIPEQNAGSRILLRATGPTAPDTYFVFSPDTNRLQRLGPRIQALNDSALARVEIHHYQAADGTSLFGYLTIPAYPAAEQPPLVVLPHGGPIARDYFGFDSMAQIIAAEGYIVFQPQFRGSAGFGRDFAQAGYGQWGELIQTDITDGVRSLIATGRVDGSRVCVAGWSFGGYAALMQAVREPELYTCAAAGAPVTDLAAILTYAEAEMDGEDDQLRAMLGADDPERMARQSPVNLADEIEIPVLLIHGREDRIVPVAQSEAMAEALLAAGVDYDTFYFDGGHALDNRRDMQRSMFQMTRFLSQHIDPR
jgi:dipeptidyl aminopeptidase/acylaminoacyl peptidase